MNPKSSHGVGWSLSNIFGYGGVLSLDKYFLMGDNLQKVPPP